MCHRMFPGGGGYMYPFPNLCEKAISEMYGLGGDRTIFLSTKAELFGVSGFSGLRLLRSRVRDTNSQVFPWVLRHVVELEQSKRR